MSLADVGPWRRSSRSCATTRADDRHAAGHAIQRLFEGWLDERKRLLTRIELSMEASRNDAIATLLDACRTQLVLVVDGILTAQHGGHEPRTADALVASFDGLLVAAMLKPAPERRRFLTESVSIIFNALAAPAD